MGQTVLFDLKTAEEVTGIDQELLHCAIKSYAIRNTLAHTGVGRVIDRCTFGQLAKMLLEDEEMLAAAPREPNIKWDMKMGGKLLSIIKAENFKELSWRKEGDSERLEFTLSSAAEERLERKRRRGKVEGRAEPEEGDHDEPGLRTIRRQLIH